MTCCCNYTFVYDIIRCTFTFQRTFLLFSVVTMVCLLVFSIGQLFAMWLDNRTHIGCTGIAYFYSISIEYFVQLVMLREMFRLYLKSMFLCPLFLNAVSYSIFGACKISAFEEFLHSLSLIYFGTFFIICGGWFEFLLI